MAQDEVVPFRFLDQTGVLPKIVMEMTYCFDDVLDAEKLKASLERLLEIGEWRSLGARFRKKCSYCDMWSINLCTPTQHGSYEG